MSVLKLYKGEAISLTLWCEDDTFFKERTVEGKKPKTYQTEYAGNQRFSGSQRAVTAMNKSFKDYQRKKGFYQSKEEAITEMNTINSCLLLSKWVDYFEKIKWPWIASPKVDGLRARWDGKLLKTRGGIEYKGLEHITKFLPGTPLDGELYVEGLSLQKIQSYILGSNTDKTKAQFIVFDIPVKNVAYSVRLSSLAKIEFVNKSVIHMPFKVIKNATESDEYYKWCLENGFEGTVYRNPDSLYECKRVNDTLKRKPWIDEEFEIIAIHFDKDNLVLFDLEVPMIGSFKCVPEWDDADRTMDRVTAEMKFLGRWATTRYQDKTDKGLPKFANVKTIRFTEGGKVVV